MNRDWIRENDEHFDCGLEPNVKLNRLDDNDKIDYLYAQHSIRFDIASERELLMDDSIGDKEKLKILVEKCNQSIREKNRIWYVIGRVKRPDWFNEIPNLYL